MLVNENPGIAELLELFKVFAEATCNIIVVFKCFSLLKNKHK